MFDLVLWGSLAALLALMVGSVMVSRRAARARSLREGQINLSPVFLEPLLEEQRRTNALLEKLIHLHDDKNLDMSSTTLRTWADAERDAQLYGEDRDNA